MGASAAAALSRSGYPVTAWARNETKLRQLPAEIRTMQQFLDKHIGTSNRPLGAVEITTNLNAINDRSEIILECVAENLDQKVELLKNLVPAAERGALITSCTSGLSITAIGHGAGIGKQLVGAHFWNPPHLMPVVEVIRGAETRDGLVEKTCDWLKAIGKIPVVCKDLPGFIGNRLLHAMWREAFHLVDQGVCSPKDVDLVARLTFGLRLPAVGPCQNADLVGLELVANIQSYLLADLSKADNVTPGIRERIASGRLGMKSGAGFHDWTDETKAAIIERRDKQIVRQLEFLREQAALE